MVVQHELQHGETMAQTLALAGLLSSDAPAGQGERRRPGRSRAVHARLDRPWAYDNERPAHEVELPSFSDRPRARHERRVRRVHRPRIHRPGRAGRPRLLRRGGGLRPLGRQAPADRGRVGEGREGAASSNTRPAPSGSGRRRLSTAIPASARFPIASTRRCSSGTSTASCAAAPGRPTRLWRGRPSATGTSRSASRSSPACAAARDA